MSFLAELRRRNVIRMAGLYLVAAWLIVQVAGTLLPMFDMPAWIARSVVIVLAIGFIPALVFAWVFELTPQGLKRDADLPPAQSIAPQTARRLDRALIVVLVFALGYFTFDKFVLAPHREAAIVAAASGGAAGARAEGSDIRESSAAPPGSIAVLPFVNMSADPENDFFSDGVSEEILNSLARIDALRIVGRTSSFQFKGRNEDVRAIGEKLGVANVLEGSVRREGERARIGAELIRTSDGFQLWSQTYDRTLEDTLAVQLDIAEHVAGALDVVLDDRQRERMRAAGVKNVEAFIHYQKGWKLYIDAHRDPAIDLIDGLRLANAEFDEATALEPTFSFAYYAKTDLYEHIIIADGRSHDERVDAQSAALSALAQAAATSPDAQQRELALAERQMLSDDWRGLSDRIGTALEEPGCSAPNWMPVFASVFGFGDALEEVLARATVCDPLNPINLNTRAWVARATGNPERALSVLEHWREQNTGRSAAGHVAAATALVGRIDEAKRLLAAVPDRDRDETDYLAALVVYRLAGDDRASIQDWSPGIRDRSSKLKQWAIADAVEAAMFGDRSEANEQAAALDARPAGGFLLAIVVTYCACGAPFDLEATPGFAARLAESGLRWPPPPAATFPPRAPAPSQ